MMIKYDKESDALYIRINKAKVVKTLEEREGFLVDIDKNGKVIGIEILNFSKVSSRKERFDIYSGQRKLPILVK
ncbi:MAG: DUF2283 domain-containing protein [Candidatus Niyogibacteria bacterium]|nr:DUF2283 domain-containing protein [Candidatus Niyogibacteria bacterium]